MEKFQTLLQRLAEAGVDFVIVGGFAAVLHGSSIVTRDLDLCCVLNPSTVGRLREALRDLHPKHRMTPQKLSFIEHPPSEAAVQNLYLETDLGVVDILSSVFGVGDFEQLNKSADQLELFGQRIKIISLADLIQAKEALGREKDLLAAKELRAIGLKRFEKK